MNEDRERAEEALRQARNAERQEREAEVAEKAVNEPGERPFQASPEIDQIAAALAKAQAGAEPPLKDSSVEVTMKQGSKYKFDYATLNAVIESMRRPLSENGLWFMQTLRGPGKAWSGQMLVTTLLHSSGQWLASEMPISRNEAGWQSYGSALTYAKRYSLCALLGVAAEEDDDANIADENAAQKRERRKASGPLTITELQKQLRQFSVDLNLCGDIDELNGLIMKSQGIIDQCAEDLSDWFEGSGDSEGVQAHVARRTNELAPAPDEYGLEETVIP